jgi:rhomboid family GlyGly-CTERM serine protease
MQPATKPIATAAFSTMKHIAWSTLQRGWINLCVLLLCWLLWYCREWIDLNLLAYDRQQLLTQPWRLFSGHLVHFTWEHFAYNVVGLVLLCVAFSPEQDPRYDACFWILGGLALSIFLYVYAPNIHIYRGLSGLVYGYAIYIALVGWRSTPFISSFLILAISARVIIHAIYTPTGNIPRLGGEIAVAAHFGGLITGILCASWRIWYRYAHSP